MSSPTLTVLVPTYGHDRVITRALESIINQTAFADCEVIVSDDCSTTKNYEIAARYSESFPNIHVQRTPSNLGVMAHYAELCGQIKSPYVAVLEGDDYWISDTKLHDQLRLLQYFPNAGLCFGRLRVADEWGSTWSQPRWQHGRNRFVCFSELLADNHIGTFSTCMYRTEHFKSAIAEGQAGYDWLVNLLVSSHSDVIFLDTSSTCYNVTSNGTWSALSPEKKRDMIIVTLEALEERVDKWQALLVRERISGILLEHV